MKVPSQKFLRKKNTFCEYLQENENILGCESRALIPGKNRVRKSHATVPSTKNGEIFLALGSREG